GRGGDPRRAVPRLLRRGARYLTARGSARDRRAGGPAPRQGPRGAGAADVQGGRGRGLEAGAPVPDHGGADLRRRRLRRGRRAALRGARRAGAGGREAGRRPAWRTEGTIMSDVTEAVASVE